MHRRPVARAGALVTAAVLVLAACGDGSTQAGAVRGSAGQSAADASTSTTNAPAATTTLPTTTVKPGATTPTTSRTTTTAAAPAGSRRLAPVAAGTYRYDTAGTTTFGTAGAQPFPALTTLVVDPPAGTVQHSTRDLRDAGGNGPVTETTLDYRPQGVYLVALRLTVGYQGASQSQDLRTSSPVLLMAAGARAGAHTEADLQGPAGVPVAHLVVDVLDNERLTVGGKSVDTVVMRVVVALTPGGVSGRQVLTVNVDPSTSLWVKERSVTDASAGGLLTLHGDYTATIHQL